MPHFHLMAASKRCPRRAGANRGTLPILLGVCAALAHPVVAATRVGIFDSPTAVEWLHSAGVESTTVSEADLTGSLPGVQVVVVPLDRIRSSPPLRGLSAFAARGGKVIAVYWGTIARPEQQSDYPVYGAATALGVRVLGWKLTGPAAVRPECLGALDSGSPDPVQGNNGSAVPATSRRTNAMAELHLSQCMLIQVEAEPGAQILARLVPASGSAPLVLAVRNGNMFYMAADLFHGGAGSIEMHRLFFWLLDQAVPGLAYSQARERAGAAVAAVIRARARLSAAASPASESIRRLLDAADAAASRAKTLAAEEQYADSLAAADQAQAITRQALGTLEGH